MSDSSIDVTHYFNLLCDLDEAELEHKASKSDGSCLNEVTKRFKQVEKLKAQVTRDGKTLDGVKQRRARSVSPTTAIIHAYLAKYPNGSVTKSEDGIKSLFDWANDNIDKDFGNAEIIRIDRTRSITFLNPVSANEQTVLLSSLRTSMSKAIKKLNSQNIVK